MLNDGFGDKIRNNFYLFLIQGLVLKKLFSCLSPSEMHILKPKVIICFLNLFCFLILLRLSLTVQDLESWLRGVQEGKGQCQNFNLIKGISCDFNGTVLDWRRCLENICYCQHLKVVVWVVSPKFILITIIITTPYWVLNTHY